ncbi:hypothetical protein EV648_106219 [Kribbella sp. VKM Ac-2568]|nr:hypothetical protein EV648_106219 [Kribbella sp. VKM Ac-2568]
MQVHCSRRCSRSGDSPHLPCCAWTRPSTPQPRPAAPTGTSSLPPAPASRPSSSAPEASSSRTTSRNWPAMSTATHPATGLLMRRPGSFLDQPRCDRDRHRHLRRRHPGGQTQGLRRRHRSRLPAGRHLRPPSRPGQPRPHLPQLRRHLLGTGPLDLRPDRRHSPPPRRLLPPCRPPPPLGRPSRRRRQPPLGSRQLLRPHHPSPDPRNQQRQTPHRHPQPPDPHARSPPSSWPTSDVITALLTANLRLTTFTESPTPTPYSSLGPTATHLAACYYLKATKPHPHVSRETPRRHISKSLCRQIPLHRSPEARPRMHPPASTLRPARRSADSDHHASPRSLRTPPTEQSAPTAPPSPSAVHHQPTRTLDQPAPWVCLVFGVTVDLWVTCVRRTVARRR